MSAMSNIIEFQFEEIRDPIVVGVADTDWDPLAHQGAWRSCSPEEVIFGFIFAIQRDLGGEADIVKRWRTVCLTTTVRFEVISTDDDMFWRNVALREEYTTIEKVGMPFDSRTLAVACVWLQGCFSPNRLSLSQCGASCAYLCDSGFIVVVLVVVLVVILEVIQYELIKFVC